MTNSSNTVPATEYRNRKETYSSDLKRFTRLDTSISWLRFAAVALAIVSFYFYLGEEPETLWLILLLFSVFGFIVLLKYHWRLRDRIRKTRSLLRINVQEIRYLAGDLNPFDDGIQYLDEKHLFAGDLDIFGRQSLFAHLNRTVSKMGSRVLAETLKYRSGKNIRQDQNAIRELSQKLDWRQELMAAGLELEEVENIAARLDSWKKSERKGTFLSSPVITVPLAVICIALLINWFLYPSVETFNWFAYSFVFNLIMVFSQFKRIREEHRRLDGIAGTLSMYSRLLQMITDVEFSSSKLAGLQKRLHNKGTKAADAVHKLSKLLGAFDQIGNVVVLLVTNGLYLNHLNILRQLYKWKQQHLDGVNDWLEVVAEVDALISLGNFAFNNPEYAYPEITDHPEIRAVNLGHPLIDKNSRVDNDLNLNNAPITILTGSNMAGKSTFLRAVGINLVLMKAGAPVCAQEFKAWPFILLCSMKPMDSLADNRSYFQAEVLKLREILNVLEKGEATIVLLDEILRGTNSHDKKEGTRLFLNKLTSFNCRAILATHDVEIAEEAEGNPEVYKASFFESKFIDGNLVFDYKLRDGVCRTPNATLLMKFSGII